MASRRKPAPINQRFGSLFVIEEMKDVILESGYIVRRLKVKCDCGVVCEKNYTSVINGGTRSCGCLTRKLKKETFESNQTLREYVSQKDREELALLKFNEVALKKAEERIKRKPKILTNIRLMELGLADWKLPKSYLSLMHERTREYLNED